MCLQLSTTKKKTRFNLLILEEGEYYFDVRELTLPVGEAVPVAPLPSLFLGFACTHQKLLWPAPPLCMHVSPCVVQCMCTLNLCALVCGFPRAGVHLLLNRAVPSGTPGAAAGHQREGRGWAWVRIVAVMLVACVCVRACVCVCACVRVYVHAGC